MKNFSLIRWSGVIGNLLEHYDTALFGFLAPFLAPLFFDEKDPLVALLLAYSILPLGLVAKLLGAFLFGLLGDSKGKKYALVYSLMGTAFATLAIGCLPLYKEIGILSPICLALVRMAQSFCSAGESCGGALFLLERTPHEKRSLLSSLYDASTVVGVLLASFSVMVLSTYGNLQNSWRYLFLAGGVTAFFGLALRILGEEMPHEKILRKKVLKISFLWKEQKGALLVIMAAAGFSYLTYSLSFTFLNGYLPLITSFSKEEVVRTNTALLILDMSLLPLFGWVASRWGKEQLMCCSALCASIGAIPLFLLLENGPSFWCVISVRIAIVTLGVAFSASYHAWAMEQVPADSQYTTLSLGYTIGSQLIGAPAPAICLWLYHRLNWVGAPGLYLLVSALLAGIAVFFSVAFKKAQPTDPVV